MIKNGEIPIDVPQDRNGDFEPKIVPKRIVFIDCIHFSVRDEHIIKKLAAYIILGVNSDGMKEVLIATAFPETEYQRCIVYQVRNTLKRWNCQ